MPVQVLMPQLGESVHEGTISRWLKSPGESVQEFEPLLEINTDKVDTEVPSPATGRLLQILAPAGAVVKVGTLLALIGTPEEEGQAQITPPPPQPAAVVAAPSAPGAVAETGASQTGAAERVGPGFISPVVAKIAHEQGVDLSQVVGTGLGGRITKRDVLAYLEKRSQSVIAEAPRLAVPPSQPPEALPPAPTIPAPAASAELLPGELIPLTPVRRSIAEHMVFSKHTSPHVTTIMEVDLSNVVAHRQANKGSFARLGVNLTFTAYFIAATVAALKAYPIVNSSWTEEGIRLHAEINIGMATSLGEAGLIVPVIRRADELSLLGLARAINDLASRARSRQLKPEEVKGGTFTITNHGISGSLFATPIINQPQCGILGVGAIQKRPIVIESPAGDALAIRPMVYLGLTFDHRILDGTSADAFLGKVVEVLRTWQ